MFARISLVAACLLTVTLAGARADAQVPRIQIQQRSHTLTIVSQFGYPIRVGMFGYSQQATFRLSFDGGVTGPDVYTQELIAGDRVVCVWNTRQELILVAALTIDRSGTITLSPQIYGAAGAAPARAGAPAARNGGAMKGGMPQLEIRPNNR